jgi:hypothetical protein
MAVILIYLPHEALHGDLFAYRLQWAGLPHCIEIGRQDSTTHFLLIYCFLVYGGRGSGPDLITEFFLTYT